MQRFSVQRKKSPYMDLMKDQALPREAMMVKMMADLLSIHTRFLQHAEDLKKVVKAPGAQGPRGEKPSIDEIRAALRPLLPSLSKEYLTEIIKPLIPKVKDGKTPLKGVDFQDGKPGKDASINIDDLLEQIGKSGKFTSKHVTGLEQTLSALKNQTSRGYLHGSGLTGVTHDATLAGAGTPASPLSVIAGGGFTELTPTGIVDGSNVTFSFVSVPSYIVADGVWFKPIGNNAAATVFWTHVGTTVTMVNPPFYSLFGVA